MALTPIATALLLFVSCVMSATADPAGPQKLVQVARASDDFGLTLLHRLELAEKQNRENGKNAPKNVMISPFSVSSVLTLLMTGGVNTTHQEMKDVLSFPPTLTDSDITTNYHTLLTGIQTLFTSSSPNTLQVANSLALQNKFQLLQTFLDTATKDFAAKLFTVDFEHKAHEATESINKWVSEKTHGKIEKLFDQDLDPTTALVLLNAIYFKGTWRYKFDANKTVSAPFRYSLPDVKAEVPTMSMTRKLKYAHFDDGDLVELPYSSDSLSMLVYLPDPRWVKDYQTIAGQFSRIVEHGSIKLAERLSQLRNATVNLHLPKFKIENSFTLNDQLRDLGIRKAFSQSEADFSRIDGRQDLFLSKVAHKTFIEVNEEGSEAAAATGAVIETKSMPIVHEFNANRPFLFVIRDNVHQVILFAGVVNKP